MTDQKDQKKEHEQILADAKKFKEEAQSYWQDTFDRGRKDKEFVTIKGAQWDDQAKAKRAQEGKPTLEFNLLRTFVRQQINTMRQNRPQIQVVPVDSGADTDVAKILGGLIKDTEEATDAEDALDQAAENAVYSGLGFVRIITDYVDERSFTQEPKFMAIENPEAVLIDPLSRKLDGSDMSKALICEWVAKDSIEKQYDKDAVDFDYDTQTDWHNKPENTVLIAEYFWKEEVKDTLLLLSDGTTEFKSVLLKEFAEEELDAFTQDERETTRTEIKWAKLSGCKVLETGVFPSKFIPIIPVYGEVTWVGEERHVFSMIHFAKDPQRLFNYWKSTEAHILQKNQDDILAVDDQSIAGYEDEWMNPGKYGASRYRSATEDGKPVAPPQRIGAAQPPTGILNATATSQQLISDTLNMHAPQMGQDVNQQSGRAIGLLQRQADTAHFHLQDNLNKMLRHCGRILIGLYPKLYDVPMVRRIVGNDGEDELVQLNAQPKSPSDAEKAINGVLNNLSIGRYDVRMDTGPSFNTQRDQSFQLMLQLMQFNPEIATIAGDLIIKDSPLVNAKEIAERMKKMMPPQVLSDDQQLPPQVQAQVQQMDQAIQQLQQQLQQASAELADKNADREVELHKVQLQAQKDIQVAQINNAGRSDVEELRGVVELLKQQIDVRNAPQDWLQQGEDVQSYAPEPPQQPQEFSQTGFEPPPDPAPQSFQDPATEQGFLMPEQMAQEPNFAPNPDQIGESALINDDINLLSNSGDGNEFG